MQVLFSGWTLLEIVNYNPLAGRLENLFHELKVQRMRLIIILRLLAREHNIEGNLIRLVHHRPVAGRHLADMKVNNTRDRRQIFLCAGDEFVGRLGMGRIGPKNHDV